MRATENEIGADAATALVEGLKELKNLKELNLESEFWMVVSPVSLNATRVRFVDSLIRYASRFKLML